MIKKSGIGISSVMASLLLLIMLTSGADAYKAQVIGVMDGDTIKVLKGRKQIRVRLYGIDSPERQQDFGSKARRFTSEMVFRKTVEVRPVEKDRYGRTVARVYVDGEYLNQLIVARGFAWHYKAYSAGDRVLEQAERHARSARNGLWSHPDPVAPWDFRRRKSAARSNYGGSLMKDYRKLKSYIIRQYRYIERLAQ